MMGSTQISPYREVDLGWLYAVAPGWVFYIMEIPNMVPRGTVAALLHRTSRTGEIRAKVICEPTPGSYEVTLNAGKLTVTNWNLPKKFRSKLVQEIIIHPDRLMFMKEWLKKWGV